MEAKKALEVEEEAVDVQILEVTVFFILISGGWLYALTQVFTLPPELVDERVVYLGKPGEGECGNLGIKLAPL